ncbi:hypothetical protein AAG738_13495 [Staphylococcus saprophyticus]
MMLLKMQYPLGGDKSNYDGSEPDIFSSLFLVKPPSMIVIAQISIN